MLPRAGQVQVPSLSSVQVGTSIHYHSQQLLTQHSSCSLTCSKTHKENCAGKAPDSLDGLDHGDQKDIPASFATSQSASDASPHPLKPFSKLQTSQELQELFSKYPTLRSQLSHIYKSTRPPQTDAEEQGSGYRNFSERGRGRSDGRNQSSFDRGGWTLEKGFNRGLSQLKRLRDGDNKEDAEGLREFSELVQMLSPKEGVREMSAQL